MPEKKRSPLFSVIALLVIFCLSWFFYHSFRQLDYDWDFSVLWPYIWQEETQKPGLFLEGLGNTILISFASIVIGSVLGVFIGWLLLAKEKVSWTAAVIYVDVFRNTPVLVQLYVAYFVVGTAFDLSAEQAGIFTLGLFCSSYVAEIFRGTIANFDRGQIDAARSIGLTPLQVSRHVIAPQALRRMLPPLVGQFVTLVKDSSLVSVIGILDLTKSALNVVSVSFRSFETWFAVAVFYLIVNTVLSTFGRYLEHRLSASLR